MQASAAKSALLCLRETEEVNLTITTKVEKTELNNIVKHNPKEQ